MKSINNKLQLSASDLVNFLGCHHLTELDRLVAQGTLGKPQYYNATLELLRQKGQEHEDAYIEHLKASGLTVCELKEHGTQEQAVEAMKKGYDIITQATLANDTWLGRTDILRKVAGKSHLGDYHYEIEDTKLAQETKAGTLLQLCLYADLLTAVQGRSPERLYVVKPGEAFPTESYRFAEYAAYYRLVKQQFEYAIAHPNTNTYPNPVAKCNTCNWWKHCDDQRHADDHLSLVAGMQQMHQQTLEEQGIKTLEQFAGQAEPLKAPPAKGNMATFAKLHGQAKIQLKGRVENKMLYNLLPFAAERGLNRLPKPSKGDLYFDIEGDHFFEEGGLEYLFGVSDTQNNYLGFWAKSRLEEKQAFEEFINYCLERKKQFPDFHIYHYAHYEPSAIKRLAQRHATMEVEVDNMLRNQLFVDLLAIIKESMQASVESYSLKETEKLTDYLRSADLRESTLARRRLATAMELKTMAAMPAEDFALVEEYNKDDCLATAKLHKLLEDIHQNNKAELSYFEVEHKEEELNEYEKQSKALFKKLIHQLPEDREDWTEEHKALWLLAHQVDFYRREDRSKWWDYFRLHEIELEEALNERHAISYLELVEELPLEGRQRTPIHRYSFPPQEISASRGDKVTEIQGEEIGSIADINIKKGLVDIKKTGKSIDIHPLGIHLMNSIRDEKLRNAFREVVVIFSEYGFGSENNLEVAKQLLLKQKPAFNNSTDGVLQLAGESGSEAAVRIARNLTNSYLPIQGPPGTGKTYTGAKIIIELIKQGKRIGVTALSHKAIRNLVEKALVLSREDGHPINAIHVQNRDNEELPEGLQKTKNQKTIEQGLSDLKVIGATSFFWAGESMIDALDYLIIDEAGQISLANVLAISRVAKNIIMLGDPQQLEQPQQGAHPENSGISALEYLLDEGKETLAKDKGLFLETTWRLSPGIAEFTSQMYYEGRLKALPALANQQITGPSEFSGEGLVYVPAAHVGNQNTSLEEVAKVKNIVDRLLDNNHKWVDQQSREHPLTSEDIMIVAPYNAQVAALSEQLPDMNIGTVDKFQGRQAPIVIYSMTSSSPEDVPRGMSFLYNPNRLNVATSRAQCICILVAAPSLFEPECHSITQMRWANGLCTYKELSKMVDVT